MDKLENVKIVEVCKIPPLTSQHSSISASKISLPLAQFDWVFMNFPPRDRLLFYPITHSDSFFNSILPNLKHSLSITLQHFLPLAGSLVWPEDSPLPFILYTPNDAVSFTVAETDSDFDNHISQAHEIKNSRFLVPTIQSSHSAIPMMAIQLTLFPNHGFSIGFSTHHVLFDGISFNLFLKSWAHICNIKVLINQFTNQVQLPPQLTPSFQRGSNVIQNPFDFVPKNRSLNYNSSDLPPSNWFRAAFVLTPTHIHKLKKRVLESKEMKTNSSSSFSSSQEEFHLSTFVVAYAYVLECLIKAKQEEAKEYIYVIVPADVRGMLDPPLSSNYFGNCVTGTGVVMEARELREEEDGFQNVAKKISHMILELKRTRSFKVYKASDLEQRHSEDSLGFEVITVSESPKFKHYETDFGWGKPKKFEMVSLVNNSISLTDTRDGDGGVEVGLLLPKHQMDNFASLFAQGLN